MLLDFCDGFPCLNGGECIATSRGPMCECKTGYHGKVCENGENN